MALQLFDRVQVAATANTTVSFTLSTAVTGYQDFSVMTNGNTTYYGSSDGTNWEVGIGTYSSAGPTLTRTTILSSSNAGSAVTFTSAPIVWIDYPSAKSVYQDANGYVGIGTATPNTSLSIYNATSAQLVVSSDTFTNIVSAKYSTDAAAPFMVLRKGRGTAAAQTAVASGDVLGQFIFQGFGGTNNRSLSQVLGYVDTYTSDTNISSGLTFGTSPSGSAVSTERMRIDSVGNVGIGTSSPNKKLEIYENNTSVVATEVLRLNNPSTNATNNGTAIGFYQGTTAYGNIRSYYTAANGWTLNLGYAAAGEAITINSFNNVGIGTSSPSAPLNVSSTASRNGALTTIQSTGASGGSTGYDVGLLVDISAYAASTSALNVKSASTSRLWVGTDGNVGIGTTSPAVKLSISSTDAMLVPVGTTAQRPTGAAGYFRYNSTLTSFEGYNGTAWSTLGNPTIQNTAPSSPVSGNLWWDSEYGRTNIYYNDGTSSQWVVDQPSPNGILLDSLDGGTANTSSYSRFIINCGGAA
jgi:hypothetical protein